MPAPRLPPVGRNLANQRTQGKNEAVVSNLGAAGASPNAIPCCVCKKMKSREHYSNRQLQKYQDTIFNPYAPGGRIKKNPKTTCKTCTAQQTTELTCCVCGKTKGLSKFAKNQRKDPDRARCEHCVRIHSDIEPDATTDEEYQSESGSDDQNGDYDDPAEAEVSATANKHFEENAQISDSTYDRSTTNTTAHGNTREDNKDYENDEYEEVEGAAVPESKPPQKLPVYIPATTSNSSVKKGGWGKPDKIPDKAVRKSAAPQESDVWDDFYRNLRDRRSAVKKPKKKARQSTPECDDEF